jgi:uncharacterized protein YdeI (BOF family)
MPKKLLAASVAVALLSTTAIAGANDPSTGRSASMSQSISASNIQNLPEDGKVRVMGTVQRVKSEDEFTLMDGTGSVDIRSDGQTRVMEGEKVTIIGQVEGGMMGKTIDAERVTRGFETSEYRAPNAAFTAPAPTYGATVAPTPAPYGTMAGTQYNSGQYGTGYSAEQYDAMQYNQSAPAAGNQGYRMQTQPQAQPRQYQQQSAIDRGYEAERPDNIEYHNSHRTKPYYKDMSMNDYNTRVQTRFKGQTRLQPERGIGE